MPKNPLAFDRDSVLANVRQADTEDLLNRITAYRDGMEPEAVAMIEEELRERGVTAAEIAAHHEHVRQEVVFLPDGMPCAITSMPSAIVSLGLRQASAF